MRTADQLQNDLQLAINLALSCWARMQADEREMALRLSSRYENNEGVVDRNWRLELRGEE